MTLTGNQRDHLNSAICGLLMGLSLVTSFSMLVVAGVAMAVVQSVGLMAVAIAFGAAMACFGASIGFIKWGQHFEKKPTTLRTGSQWGVTGGVLVLAGALAFSPLADAFNNQAKKVHPRPAAAAVQKAPPVIAPK